MQITLDKPTFLTSLTDEKPEQNQTDSLEGGLDFLTTMMQQGAPSVNEQQAPVATPLSSDETPSAPVDLQLDDISNFLIEMGYFTNAAPVTPELPKPADLTQTLDDKKNQDDKTNQLEANSKQSSVSSQLEVRGQPSSIPLMEHPGQAFKPYTNPLEAKGQLGEGVYKEVAVKPTKQDDNKLTNSLPSQIKPDGVNLDEPREATTLGQGAPSANSATQGNKAENMKGRERVQPAAKDGRAIAEINNKALLALMNKKFTEVTEATVSNSTPAEASTPLFVETTPDQKVVNTLNQMAAWLQTKVDAEPKLKMGVNTPLTETNFLLAKQGVGGAATPARAAFEARVEMNQVMSSAELNLTTYHANIKIYPPELGKVTAKLKMDKNIATLEVTAANKEVKALLQTHINSLREQFAGSNIQLDKIDIILAPAKEQSTTNSDGRGKGTKEEEQIAHEEVVNQKATASKTSKKSSNNTVDAYV